MKYNSILKAIISVSTLFFINAASATIDTPKLATYKIFLTNHGASINIDPRNMVKGTVYDEPYVIVGRDAILQATLAHSISDPALIDAQLEKMHTNGELKLRLNHIDNESTINGDNKDLLFGYDPEVDLFIIRHFKPELLNDKTEDEQLLFVKEQRAKAILAGKLHIQNKENLPQSTYYRQKYLEDFNDAFKLELLKKYKSAIAKNDDDATNKPYYSIFDITINRLEKKNRDFINLPHYTKDKYLYFLRDILINRVGSLLEATEIRSTYSEDDIQSELVTLNSSTDTDEIRQAHNILVRGGYIPKPKDDDDDAHMSDSNELALRFLAQQEISKKIMVHEFGIKPEGLIVVAQPDNYINMVLQPATDHHILMNDPRTVDTFIDEIIDHADYNDIKIDSLSNTLADFRKNAAMLRADNKKMKVYDLLREQLDRAGLTVVRTPGIMESKDIKVNWINGMTLENEYGESIFTTLTAGDVLDQGLERWLNNNMLHKFKRINFIIGNKEDQQYGYGLNSKIKMH